MQQDTGTTSSINQQPNYKNHWAGKMEENNDVVSADIKQNENPRVNES